MFTQRGLQSFLPAVVLGVVVAGCAGTSGAASTEATSPTPTASAAASPTVATLPDPTVAPTGPFALRSGTLPAGEYTTTAFQPTVTFTLVDGWRGMFPDDDDEVALEGPGRALFAISRVSQVVDPTTGTAVDAPDDLVEWLTTHPRITSQAPRVVTVGGLAGQMVDVVVTNGSELEILAFPTGNLRIPQGVTYRIYVVPLDGPDMTIIVGAPNAGFAETIEMFQPVLDSLAIDSAG
jgi:hypothetical protein